jgi:zinc transport system substrate-binding protein
LQEGITHSHGPKGKHEHEGFAFTIWINFKYAIIQAETIKNALIKLLPDSKDNFEKNYMSLKDDLGNLDKRMSEIAFNISEPIIASHPVYQYFAEGYDINIISVHWEPTDMPDEIEWEKFDKLLKANPTSIMIWEDEPIPKVEQELLKRGIKVVVFNPGANAPANGDFLSIMKRNIVNLGDL